MDDLMYEQVGKVWSTTDLLPDYVENDYQKTIALQVVQYLSNPNPRSVLISGDRGTGKSTIINLVASELSSKRWDIIIAGALDIIAGQMYIGMLDGRIKHFLSVLEKKKRVLWIAPKFHELFFSGKTVQDPSGILDRFLPHIEKGSITVLGEIFSNDLEKILRYRPQLKTIMEIVRHEPFSEDETIQLAKKWCELPRNQESWNAITKKDLKEATKFSKQFLGFTKEPGNLFSFLKVTQTVVDAKKNLTGKRLITPDDFMISLSAITGLPLSILDDRKKLDIESVRKKFFGRVIGQDEAVNALIERIALIKAGFTDPSRPLGVFLFVGPTGTGKTEIAKTLADYLFGSEERMIRMDMSEFKTPDALERLTGSGYEDSVSLVNEIRKNPFSVVLLDEFEKAHSNIWDLFLQLFDDARLTDSNGNTADFKHAIVIMTSNLGSSIPVGSKLGFGNNSKEFDSQDIYKTLNNTFKPEFINRIDRIITFNPLSRSTMRQILKNELQKVLERRGFRNKQWAVEWDESALEFLLEKGFSAHLGARPMKRAIEQFLLTPLAMTIVTNQFPEGDQFLFVRRNGDQLQADFIDPDAPEIDWQERKKQEIVQFEKAKDLSLKKIALDPQGNYGELEVLKKEMATFQEKVESDEWESRKEGLLQKMTEPDFWNSVSRKEVLSEIEYRDRFKESLLTVKSILERMSELKKTYKTLPAQLIRQVGERLQLMHSSIEAFENGVSQDALIRVHYDPLQEKTNGIQTSEFWERIVNMYTQWAKKRKMTYEIILQVKNPEAFDFIMAVEGFAAFQILEKEKGIHIWEQLKKENKYDRARVKVEVIPFPDGVTNIESIRGTAKKLFDTQTSAIKITRKYRNKPSPLVRDEISGWRSGRLDKILGGDFDLME